MSSFPRYALAMVILLVAFVFFASVSCPPIAELEAPAGQTPQYPLAANPGTTKALPGPLQIEDVFQREEIVPEPSFQSCSVSVQAADGLPLAGANVRIFATDGSRASALIQGSTNAEGNLTIKWLPDGIYRMEVSHSVYFPVDPLTVQVPAATELHFDVTLEIGARVLGELRTPEGGLVQHGLVRLHNREAHLEIIVRADASGNFDSGPLVAGLWAVEWLPHAQAISNPRLHFDAALAPGNQRRLRFTIASRQDKKNPAVGVAELFE